MAKDRIKLAIIGNANSVHVRKRARALADADALVTVISDCPPDSSYKQGNNVDIKFEGSVNRSGPLGLIRRSLRIRGLWRLIRDTEADILYVHYASGSAAWLAQLDPRPLAINLMGSDAAPTAWEAKSWASRELTTRLFRKAELITAKAPYLGKQAVKLGAKSCIVKRVLWGIDLNKIEVNDEKVLRKQLNIDCDAPVIFSPRMLRKRYNIHLIVGAMKRVLKAHPKAKLVIAEYSPDEKYKKVLDQMILELGVDHAVQFIPEIKPHEIYSFMSMADVTVNLSSIEGFPQSVLESMAVGTPSIVAKIEAFEGVVNHGHEVWLTELSSDKIADGIAEILHNSTLRNKMITAGHDFVRSNADLNRETQRVMEWLTPLANQTKRPSATIAERFYTILLIMVAPALKAMKDYRKRRGV